jgi:hypothetical protein
MKDKPNTRHLTTQNVANKVINIFKIMTLLGFEPTTNLGAAESSIGLIVWNPHWGWLESSM